MIDEDTRKRLSETIRQGPAHRLAYEDRDLLAEDDLRSVRLQLELIKPERALRHHAIRSTVIVFGSARIVSPEVAQKQLTEVRAGDCASREGQRALIRAESDMRLSRYYSEARRFAKLVSARFQQEGRRDFVVMSGGGPGIMEAANLGAFDTGARSVGLNITLPHEQAPNPFITPDLAFRFHYFAIRKMHFLMRAKALVAFPGGYGTFDELFEVLTLAQTGKLPRLPIVLFGPEFWDRAVDFDFLLAEGMIAPDDRKLFTMVETAEEAIAALVEFYHCHPPPALHDDPEGVA